MASSLYGLGREGFLLGAIAWVSDNIQCHLQDTTGYTLSIDTDQFVSDLGTVTASSGNLVSKTSTLGVAGAADLTPAFTAVPPDIAQEYVILAVNTGTPASDRLILLLDSDNTGLPVTPNGGDINIQWDTGPNRIFKL